MFSACIDILTHLVTARPTPIPNIALNMMMMIQPIGTYSHALLMYRTIATYTIMQILYGVIFKYPTYTAPSIQIHFLAKPPTYLKACLHKFSQLSEQRNDQNHIFSFLASSRAVLERKIKQIFAKKGAGPPGLVVLGGDSCMRCHQFDSQCSILGGPFFTFICCTIVSMFERSKINNIPMSPGRRLRIVGQT